MAPPRPQLQLDFAPQAPPAAPPLELAPAAPVAAPPSNPTPVDVQYEDAATSNWPSEQHADSAPHDPWAKWPWNDEAAPEHTRALSKLLDEAHGWTHDVRTFEIAIDLWTACLDRFSDGEARYLQLAKDVHPKAMTAISHGFGVLLQHFYYEGGYFDVLGAVYMEVRSKWAGSKLGQFFTPWDLCKMLAHMQIGGPALDAAVAARTRISVCDPCCGSGAMLLAAKAAVANLHGRRATQILDLYGQDIDQICCKMAKIQLRMTNERWMRAWAECCTLDMQRQEIHAAADLLVAATT